MHLNEGQLTFVRKEAACVGILVCPARSADGTTRRAAAGALAGPVPAVHARQRPQRHPASGHERAGRGGERLVSRRLGQREAGTHRIRAPVRAPDVRRLEARARRAQFDILLEGAGGDNNGSTTNDRTNYVIDVPVERARAGAVSRVGSHGLPARHDDAGARERPARRRQERAPAELREPAVRHGVDRDRQDAVAGDAPIQLADDRLHGGPHGREPRRTSSSSSRSTTRRTTPAWSSPATSTSIGRARSSRSGSARSRAARSWSRWRRRRRF